MLQYVPIPGGAKGKLYMLMADTVQGLSQGQRICGGTPPVCPVTEVASTEQPAGSLQRAATHL
jgi:hypothetical protein